MAEEITLQSLMKEYRLSQELLDKEVGDKFLREVSWIIDDHDVLGRELGLKEPELMDINHNTEDHNLRKRNMLMKWRQRYAFKATNKKLIEALLECHENKQARDVCKLLAPGMCSTSCGHI